jgi:hypothetical protein
MTEAQLGAYAGIVLSLVIAYFPGVREWYDAKTGPVKAQIMGGLLVLVALVVFGLSCANLYPLVACSVDGAKELVGILVAALIANQATFVLAVSPFKAQAS